MGKALVICQENLVHCQLKVIDRICATCKNSNHIGCPTILNALEMEQESTDKQTDRQTEDATKCIISPASRSITKKLLSNQQVCSVDAHQVEYGTKVRTDLGKLRITLIFMASST